MKGMLGIAAALLMVAVLGLGVGCGTQQAESNLGDKVEFGNGTIYYIAGVGREAAVKLGHFFVKEDVIPLDRPSTFQLRKTGSTWEVRFVAKTGIQSDPEIIQQMKTLASIISTGVFDGQTVEIHLCNDSLETIATILE